jgi:hypothetical protein
MFLVFLCFPFSAFAQSGTIFGRVLAAFSEETLPEAVVTFYQLQVQSDSIDGKLVKTVRTDKHGNYEVKLDVGFYLARVDAPGFLIASAWNIYVSRNN